MSVFSPVSRVGNIQFDSLPSNTNLLFSPVLSVAAMCSTSLRDSQLEEAIHRAGYCVSSDVLDIFESARNSSDWMTLATLDINDSGYRVADVYKSLAKERYLTEVMKWDFEKDRKESEKHVNVMFQMVTQNATKKVLRGQGRYTPEWIKRLVVGHVDVNSAWDKPFNSTLTSNIKFQLIDGSVIKVPALRDKQLRSHLVFEYGKNLQGLVLPLSHEGFDVVIVTHNGIKNGTQEYEMDSSRPVIGVSEMKESFEQLYNATTEGTYHAFNEIVIPKLFISQIISTKKSYSSLGLYNIFRSDDKYRNPNLERYRDVAVDVLQGLTLNVTEAGISSAMRNMTEPLFPIIPDDFPREKFIVDRPFFVLVRAYGLPVIIGRILNPTSHISPYRSREPRG